MKKNKALLIYQDALKLKNKPGLQNKTQMEVLLKKSISLDDNLKEAKLLLAHIYIFFLRKFSESIEIYNEVLDQLDQDDNMNYISCQNGLGLAHSFRGFSKDSIKDYHSSISYLNKTHDYLISHQRTSKPYLTQCLNWLGVSYLGAGDCNSAIKTLDIALSVEDENGQNRENKSNKTNNVKKEDEKNDALSKSLEENNVFTNYVIGNCHDQVGNFEKAIDILTRVKTYYEKNNNVFWLKNTLANLGSTYYKRDMYYESVQQLNIFYKHKAIETEFHTESLARLCYMLSMVKTGEDIDKRKRDNFVKKCEKNLINGTYEHYFFLFELTSKIIFLQTAHNKVQKIINHLSHDKKTIFSKCPIPLKIIRAFNE